VGDEGDGRGEGTGVVAGREQAAEHPDRDEQDAAARGRAGLLLMGARELCLDDLTDAEEPEAPDQGRGEENACCECDREDSQVEDQVAPPKCPTSLPLASDLPIATSVRTTSWSPIPCAALTS